MLALLTTRTPLNSVYCLLMHRLTSSHNVSAQSKSFSLSVCSPITSPPSCILLSTLVRPIQQEAQLLLGDRATRKHAKDSQGRIKTKLGLMLLPRKRPILRERGIAKASCPSVRPSVSLKYRGQIGWNSAKVISRLISLTISLSADPNMTDLLQSEHP